MERKWREPRKQTQGDCYPTEFMTFLWSVWIKTVYVEARDCVSCVGLDIRNFVLVFKVRLILTGMHKLAGNHADVAHVVNCLAVFMMFMT